MILKHESSFTPAPEGVHNAVCVDITPIKVEETQWGPKERFRIVWELAAKMESGKPFIASQRYTASLNEKSSLRKDLKSWRGRDFTAEELRGFDMEKIIGAAACLVITHTEKEGTTYSNVTAVTKAMGEKLKPSGKYVRAKDRDDAPKAEEKVVEAPEMASDDIPF